MWHNRAGILMLPPCFYAKIAAVVATPQRLGSLSKELRMQTGIADVIAALLSSHQQC